MSLFSPCLHKSATFPDILVAPIENEISGTVTRWFCDCCLYNQYFRPTNTCPECQASNWTEKRKIHVKVVHLPK